MMRDDMPGVTLEDDPWPAEQVQRFHEWQHAHPGQPAETMTSTDLEWITNGWWED